MRPIDADALIERMYHNAFEIDTDMQKWDSGCWIRYKMFENAMDSAPIVDAVSVVRCKECKYFIDNLTEDATDEMYDACRWDWKRRIPNPDDFCSHGEREGE